MHLLETSLQIISKKKKWGVDLFPPKVCVDFSLKWMIWGLLIWDIRGILLHRKIVKLVGQTFKRDKIGDWGILNGGCYFPWH